MPNIPPDLPGCSGRWLDPLWSAATTLAVYIVLSPSDLSDTELAAAIITAVALVISAVELRTQWPGFNHRRTTLKTVVANSLLDTVEALLGVAAVFGLWWLFWGEYGLPHYRPLWVGAKLAVPALPPIIFLAAVANSLLRGGAPCQRPLSTALRMKNSSWDKAAITNALLALFVRAIFLPLNFCTLVHGISQFRGREFLFFESAWPTQQAAILAMLYALLLAAITPAYLFSSRLLATHTRACDRTLLGWVATLCCYAPLSAPVFDRWLNYRGPQPLGDRPWADLLAPWPTVSLGIGGAIIALEVAHWWGEASFGLRASNLSNRGIITTGPYRFCKHPIYLSKCLGWALIYLPFAEGGFEGVRRTLLFAGVCAIYAVRSYAEERLLSSDPYYVRYALWMDENGIFSRLGRYAPQFRFETRYARWRDHT